ncbi:MAG: 3-mercaptopyruvate sulfurtransferase [Rhodobacterales bacterium]|nr:3-mercaptopyruvate sulfurtransferase [Rhodobacterales bacterium]
MDYLNPSALVDVDWLAAHLDAPDVRVVDATHHLPDSERDAVEEFGYRHIPGAVYFDIDDVCDSDSDLPHMLPSPEKFSSKVRKLGLGDGNRIVVYDTAGGFMAAARVWWMFRVYGHTDVSMLNGGLQAWTKAGHRVDDMKTLVHPRHFSAHVNTTMVRELDQVMRNLETKAAQVVDTRSEDRFVGSGEEPRPVKHVGRIPGSFNVPITRLMDARRGYAMRSADELKAAFVEAGVDLSKPIITSCGSGVTACVGALALHLLGHKQTSVYDGSWVEWGNRDDTPVETGTA